MKKLLLILLSLPTLLHAAPNERWYEVEVLIFSYNSKAYRNSELWPLDYSEPSIAKSRKLSRKTGSAFSLLPKNKLQLGAAVKRIINAPDLEQVLHLGWIQPGLPKEKAVAVHIYDEMLQKAYSGEAPPKLDGTLRLSLSRYLSLESDLIWRDPLSAEELALRQSLPQTVPESATEENGMTGEASTESALNMAEATEHDLPLLTHQVYRMQQTRRRMRSNEIHYLDHPRFGIVAQVRPIKTQ